MYKKSIIALELPSTGMFDEETVSRSGLPVYTFTDADDKYIPSDLWTFTDMKNILDVHLTIDERKSMIVAFQRSNKQQQGYAALYSFHQVINKRYDTNIKFFPQFEE